MDYQQFSRYRFETILIAKALKNQEFKQRLLSDSKLVYEEELKRGIPAQARIKILEEAEDLFYVILPYVPPNKKLTDEQFLKIAAREITHRKPCWGIGDPID